jgi:hypothetical protein
MSGAPVPPAAVEAHLERVLASRTFRSADRSRRLLDFLVRETLAGRADRLKDYTLGAEALGRGDQFDPCTDPIARVEASRLRARLDMYYATEGVADPLRIVVPKGGYVPVFEERRLDDRPAASESRDVLPGRRSPFPWPAGAAALLLGAAAFTWWSAGNATKRSAPELRLEMTTPATTDPASFAIAPDGRRIVFVATAGGVSSLWLRQLDETAARPLPGTTNASVPFWSPDGNSIAFFADNQIRAVHLQTGVVEPIGTTLIPTGAAWSQQGVILHSIVPDSPLMATTVADRSSRAATSLSEGQAGHRGPHFCPAAAGSSSMRPADRTCAASTPVSSAVLRLPGSSMRTRQPYSSRPTTRSTSTSHACSRNASTPTGAHPSVIPLWWPNTSRSGPGRACPLFRHRLPARLPTERAWSARCGSSSGSIAAGGNLAALASPKCAAQPIRRSHPMAGAW